MTVTERAQQIFDVHKEMNRCYVHTHTANYIFERKKGKAVLSKVRTVIRSVLGILKEGAARAPRLKDAVLVASWPRKYVIPPSQPGPENHSCPLCREHQQAMKDGQKHGVPPNHTPQPQNLT